MPVSCRLNYPKYHDVSISTYPTRQPLELRWGARCAPASTPGGGQRGARMADGPGARGAWIATFYFVTRKPSTTKQEIPVNLFCIAGWVNSRTITLSDFTPPPLKLRDASQCRFSKPRSASLSLSPSLLISLSRCLSVHRGASHFLSMLTCALQPGLVPVAERLPRRYR